MSDAKEEFINYVNRKYPAPTLTKVQVAEVSGLHYVTIDRMRVLGKGPKFFSLGKTLLCLKKDFFDWYFSFYSRGDISKLEEQ